MMELLYVCLLYVGSVKGFILENGEVIRLFIFVILKYFFKCWFFEIVKIFRGENDL